MPDEGGSPGADRLFDDFVRRQITLVAPRTLEQEIISMMWKAVRDGRVLRAESDEAFERSRGLGVVYISGLSADRETLELANKLRHSSYDCSYLAVALALGCDLYTADRRFIRLTQGDYPCVKDVAEYA